MLAQEMFGIQQFKYFNTIPFIKYLLGHEKFTR